MNITIIMGEIVKEIDKTGMTHEEFCTFIKDLLQVFPFGLYIIDESGNFLFQNDIVQHESIPGIKNKKCWELFSGNGSQCNDCPFISGVKIGETAVHDTCCPVNGKIYQMHYTGINFRGNRAIMAISHDMTYCKHLEESLKESGKMYRSLLNASPEGIIIMNMKGYITEISNITLEIFGAENRNEFLGEHFSHFIRDEEIAKWQDVLKKTEQEGLVQNVEFILTKKNHVQCIGELSTTLIQEDDGKPIAYMAIVRDISQRKKIEQQLLRTERMVSLGEMASAMAHEINQPLLSISLGIENLFLKIQQSKAVNEKYFKNKSEKIFEDILRIEHIIDHVRFFSRDHDDYIVTSFNINDSIKNAVSMISEQYKHHSIGLNIRLNKKIRPIIGNTYKFEQVILNLLSNAKDALEEKTKTLKQDFEKTIGIRTYCDALTNYVEVRDNGIGIRNEDIDRIMLPFYTTKKVGKGTGLGLSISFGIIKELNGNIEVESEPLKGTLFRVSLPTIGSKP